jgi:hypothetical protein
LGSLVHRPRSTATPMTLEDRVAYIAGNSSCGGAGRSAAPPLSLEPTIGETFMFRCDEADSFRDKRTRWGAFPLYVTDMMAICRPGSVTKVFFGDTNDSDREQIDSKTIVKSRFVDDRCGILLPLNLDRHFGAFFPLWMSLTYQQRVRGRVRLGKPQLSHLRQIPWGAKVGAIHWRGADTGSHDRGRDLGYSVRRSFVWGLNSTHDVQFAPKNGSGYTYNLKASVQHMLTFKYLLMLPGNDVATGLKWAMASNSVVFMPTPRKESWLMEGMLVPWKHYVPVEEPRELDARLQWAREHDNECVQISRRANAWIESILNQMFEPVPMLVQVAEDRLRCPTVADVMATPRERRWPKWDEPSCTSCLLQPCNPREHPCCVHPRSRVRATIAYK